MKRILILFGCLSFLFSCENVDNGTTYIYDDISSQYLLDGIVNNDLDTYVDNNQIVRMTGKPGITSISIGSADLSKYEPCFVLYVVTGTTPETTVSSAIIKLDDMVVLNTSDFHNDGTPYTFEVCNLTENSTLTVEVRGGPGSFVNVWIEGKRKSVVPAEGLVVYYPLDGNSNDESGNNRNGTPFNLSYTSNRYGQSNKAGYFNGVSSYVSLPGVFGDCSEMTFSAWIKIESQDYLHNAIISPPAWAQFMHVTLHQNNIYSNVYCYYISPWDENSTWTFYEGATIPIHIGPELNTWAHIVIVFDNLLGCSYMPYHAKAFLNGNIIADFYAPCPHSLTHFLRPTYNLRVGKGYEGEMWYFHGAIDDIRIYYKSLSDSEVQLLYNE